MLEESMGEEAEIPKLDDINRLCRNIPYHSGFEDITDDDDDNDDELLPNDISLFPLEQCSRTSPGNHSTIRRWKQRKLHKSKGEIRVNGNDARINLHNDDGQELSLNHCGYKTKENSIMNCERLQSDTRCHSSVGFSSLYVETDQNLTSEGTGPSSAPSCPSWRQSPSSFGNFASPLLTPTQTSTPVHTKKPSLPFNISNILGTPVTASKDNCNQETTFPVASQDSPYLPFLQQQLIFIQQLHLHQLQALKNTFNHDANETPNSDITFDSDTTKKNLNTSVFDSGFQTLGEVSTDGSDEVIDVISCNEKSTSALDSVGVESTNNCNSESRTSENRMLNVLESSEKGEEQDIENFAFNYHPKKKIFRNWPLVEGSKTERSPEYKHKKIRRESKEVRKEYNDQIDESKEICKSDIKEELANTEESLNKTTEKKRNEVKVILKVRGSNKNKKHSSKKLKVDKWETVEKVKEEVVQQHIPSCTLKEVDLIDGVRVLARFGSHFYPGRLTEVSPPDIYGIIIDKERGNKPHIFSREEIIRDAILEMRPETRAALKLGDRVCVFWSKLMNYLHPGTVAGADIDDEYVIIQLDDGDSRDIHLSQIRYLPEDYPVVDSTAESTLSCFQSRKRGYSGSERKVPLEEDGNINAGRLKTKKSNRKKKSKNKSKNNWTVVVKEVVQNENNQDEHVEEDRDSAFESDASKENSDFEADISSELSSRETKKMPVTKNSITAFLPHQLLWSWGDPGRKESPRSRKLLHDCIEKDDEVLHVGDCAVFLSTGRPDRPYIGQIESLWEAVAGMRVRVSWFYHPSEVVGAAVGGGRVEDIKTKGALFSSNHCDDNDVQTISHKCNIVQIEEFKDLLHSRKVDLESNDTYYLAGEYDPVEGIIIFQSGVLD